MQSDNVKKTPVVFGSDVIQYKNIQTKDFKYYLESIF